MAAALNIGAARYNKYEIGRSEPPYEVLLRIARLTNVSIDFLVAGDATGHSTVSSPTLQSAVEVMHGLPIPAVLYDGLNRLCECNRQYRDVFFPRLDDVLQPGTPQEFLLRAWAYSQGHDPVITEEFVRQRLNPGATGTGPVDVRIGGQRLRIAESRNPRCKLVLIMQASGIAAAR